MNSSLASNYVEHKSGIAFEPTLDRLAGAIEDAGMAIFAKIDHATGAKDVGLSIPPSVVLIYGHARGGTPIMQVAPRAALDLPLRVLVREDDDGQTLIAFHPIVEMLRQYDVPDAVSGRLVRAQQILVESI
jgi:uncharacterized protein (DUF302 family)